MVDEYLSEREQAEQLRHWLAANWLWMAAGVLLVVGGWYGYRWWLSEKSEKSLAAEARFTAMLEALGQNNKAEGLKIGGEIGRYLVTIIRIFAQGFENDDVEIGIRDADTFT